MLNGMGRDRGPAAALEQAMLPETTDAGHRTWILAYYNITLDVGHAVGALGGAVPTLLAAATGMRSQVAHQVTLLMLAGLMAATAAPYALLSVDHDRRSTAVEREAHPPVDARTRRVVGRLALFFGLDSLGGGFLSASLVAYWFFHQFGIAERDIAFVFFGARALNAVSHLGAAWLARRVGLLNTMVFTHLPSSLFLMAAPSAPGVWLAVILFLAREALVEMDVPTRQSYVMAIVPPAHRTFASGVTNFARTTTWAIGSAGAGFVMQHILLAGPLLIGGILKIGYDLLLYWSFRAIKPPEEVSWRPS
jgi:hypothetical protein